MSVFAQTQYAVRCEWGEQGVQQLAPRSDVVIIVDVLSFSTCVDIATARGALIWPWRWKDETAREFAAIQGAELAGTRQTGSGYSLSPASMLKIPPQTRLVLPSPNGATLSLATGGVPTLVGCLRNCRAVAETALGFGKRIAVIPAGERWPDGSLRPAWEDWVGAGAILDQLQRLTLSRDQFSPEAHLALAAFQPVKPILAAQLRQCISGQELIERGFAQDVELAAEWLVSGNTPQLVNQAYFQSSTRTA